MLHDGSIAAKHDGQAAGGAALAAPPCPRAAGCLSQPDEARMSAQERAREMIRRSSPSPVKSQGQGTSPVVNVYGFITLLAKEQVLTFSHTARTKFPVDGTSRLIVELAW